MLQLTASVVEDTDDLSNGTLSHLQKVIKGNNNVLLELQLVAMMAERTETPMKLVDIVSGLKQQLSLSIPEYLIQHCIHPSQYGLSVAQQDMLDSVPSTMLVNKQHRRLYKKMCLNVGNNAVIEVGLNTLLASVVSLLSWAVLFERFTVVRALVQLCFVDP